MPYVDSKLAQTMRKRVLIDFFEVTMTEVYVKIIRGLPHSIT